MKHGLLIFMWALIVVNISAQEKKITVAVLEFQTSGGLEKSEVATLSNRFRGILVATNAFEVVEREKMNEVLKSQDFNMSDACNTAECAVQVGQLLGVEAMIAGDLGKIGETFTIDLRLIDVQTGKIIQTRTKDYVGKVDGLLGAMQVIANSFAGTEKAAVQTVNIKFVSEPSGATVFIDDVMKGRTPVTIDIPAGKHRMKVSKQGFADYTAERDVTQALKDKGINVNLKKVYSLSVVAKTPKADGMKEAGIYIDGKLAGKNTAVLSLTEGRYALKVSTGLPDVKEFTESVYLNSDRKIDATLDFTDAYKEKMKSITGTGYAVEKPANRTMWYILGGAAVLGGGAAVLLSGGKNGSKDLKIYDPQLPPNP